MIVLAIDTATAETAVATLGPDAASAERRFGPGPDGRPRHGPALLGMVAELVEEAGGWQEIGLLAVGVGPGSFTGIRIGVSTARALAQARGLPIVGVQSTAALAAAIPAQGDRARVAVIDARRGEVFAALLGAGEGRAGEPVVCAPEGLSETLQLPAGPLAAGDGAVRFRGELQAAGIEVLADEDPVHRLSARHTGALAQTVAAGTVEGVRPLYLRRPDAERWRKRDGGD